MKTHKKYKTQEKKRFERKSLVIKIVLKLKTHWTVKNKNSRLGTAGENKELENNSKHFPRRYHRISSHVFRRPGGKVRRIVMMQAFVHHNQYK